MRIRTIKARSIGLCFGCDAQPSYIKTADGPSLDGQIVISGKAVTWLCGPCFAALAPKAQRWVLDGCPDPRKDMAAAFCRQGGADDAGR